MSWTGVITNAGAGLLSDWTDGKTFSICSSYVGTGTVPREALLAQTDLVQRIQQASLVSYQTETGGRKIKLQLDRKSVV